MKVLLVGKGAPDQGGIRTFLDTLLTGDVGREHELAFLNVAHDEDRQGGQASLGNVRRTVRDAQSVRRASRGTDVVHIHTALAPGVTTLRAGVLALAARSSGARVIVHAHGGLVALWLTSARRRQLARLALHPADTVVCVSTGGLEALRRALPPARLTMIDNAVDVESFHPNRSRPNRSAHHPPRVLFAGGLTPRKGVLDLIQASELLRERGVAHELWLAGGMPDEGAAAQAAVQDALPGDARKLGVVGHADMPAVYREVDVFCLPSWWEAMPLTVLEAMSSGLPVVATDVGDIRRAVVDGETGLLVPPRSPAALADALEALLTSPARRETYGDRGRERVVAHFSREALDREISRLYQSLGKDQG